MQVIDAQGLDYRILNSKVRGLVESGEQSFHLENVNGHRYIACGLSGPLSIEIEGTGGNDLAAYINGPKIVVNGNVQDCICNTMNSGTVVVTGRAGDILGYGASGGEIYIRGDVGSRCGIHLKGTKEKAPVMVIGGVAGDFLGEYMAGGTIIVLGLDNEGPPAGRQIGVGMHGGAIYIRGNGLEEAPGVGTEICELTSRDTEIISRYVQKFSKHFDLNYEQLMQPGFIKIAPKGKRPYGTMYVGI
ncbi:MAG: hypothetical protein ACM3PP_13160 [Candidatus Saccharibacteria bacterium]